MKQLFLFSLAAALILGCNKTDTTDCCKGVPQMAGIDSSFIAVPDIFTPNGDGINDILYVRTRNISSLTFTIENSRNKIMFTSSDMSIGWDGSYKGKQGKERAYTYTISALTINGQALNLSGHIAVVRNNCLKGSPGNCLFDTQFNGVTFDPMLPSHEHLESCK